MAAKARSSNETRVENDPTGANSDVFTCSVCLEIFVDPVTVVVRRCRPRA